MLQRKTIIRIAKYVALSAVVVLLLLVLFSGSEDIYIDTYSGRLKTIRKQFLVERSYISDTDFSRLVESYELAGCQEEWKIATSHHRRILPPGTTRICCQYGKAVASCCEFVVACDMGYASKELMPSYLKQLLQCMQEERLDDMERMIWDLTQD
ncbi:MAG TPA: hypothetical protein PLH67_01985 [Lentisphaeria bacterium]|nr:hypothetical protein [Lentisphaeria bacterium]